MSQSPHARRQPRLGTHSEAHLWFGGRSLVTSTREVSARGLFVFVDPPPAVGERVRVVLHAEGVPPIGLDCEARHVMPGVGAGLELADHAIPSEVTRFERFVEELSTSATAWQAISGFVRSAEQPEPGWTVPFEAKELVDVGESGEAFRVFFERYPPIPIAQSDLARSPESRAHAELSLAGVSAAPILLKLHPNDRVRRAHLGITARGAGYAAVVPGPDGHLGPSFYALSGREQLVVREGGRPVYPFFTEAELARIHRDVARTVDGARRASGAEPARGPGRSLSPGHSMDPAARAARARAAAAVVEPSAPASAVSPLAGLAAWTGFDARTEALLLELFEILQAETRVYSLLGAERPVRLLRNLTVLVRGADGAAEEATLMHDGRRLCVLFGLKSRTGLRIRPLAPTDALRLPGWSA